jgi:hypothetical protein
MAMKLRLPAARGARLALFAVAGLLVAGALAFALWWLFVRPRAAKVEAATARVEEATATGTAGASQDALKITVDVQQQRVAIDTITRENDRAIHIAAGSTEKVGPDVARAGRAALCLRAAYQHQPECSALRGAGEGVGPAGDDAWRFTPAGR